MKLNRSIACAALLALALHLLVVLTAWADGALDAVAVALWWLA